MCSCRKMKSVTLEKRQLWISDRRHTKINYKIDPSVNVGKEHERSYEE